MPASIHSFYDYYTPLPQNLSNNEENFHSTSELIERNRNGENFDERFFSSTIADRFTDNKAELVRDNNTEKAHPEIWHKKSVFFAINFLCCGKPRVVFSVTTNDGNRKDKINRIKIEMKPYQCGYSLVTNSSSSLFNSVFTREKLNCQSPIQIEYFSVLMPKYFLPPVCGR